jgi:hypothetical protein
LGAADSPFALPWGPFAFHDAVFHYAASYDSMMLATFIDNRVWQKLGFLTGKPTGTHHKKTRLDSFSFGHL